jgi:2-phosphosulfolactate phosphatase
MTKWHVVQGDEGCRLAVEKRCVAIVVDALRASTTATALLRAGANQILVVREVEDAYEAKKQWPDALLVGERGGLPPEGFDHGNSPMWLGDARGRDIVFTTTTGAARLIDCWGAAAIYMGSTTNARAVTRRAASHGTDVVVIPAGLTANPTWNAQEDWTAAAVIASASGAPIGEGAKTCAEWTERIHREGTKALFEQSPHAEKLRQIGLHTDIACCAMIDVTNVVPVAVERVPLGVILRKAGTS